MGTRTPGKMPARSAKARSAARHTRSSCHVAGRDTDTDSGSRAGGFHADMEGGEGRGGGD